MDRLLQYAKATGSTSSTYLLSSRCGSASKISRTIQKLPMLVSKADEFWIWTKHDLLQNQLSFLARVVLADSE